MTEEEFREIIKPIGLIGKEENRIFIETALIGNFKMWFEDKQALDLASVSKSVNCKHENETLHQGNGFVYKTCTDCGEDI